MNGGTTNKEKAIATRKLLQADGVFEKADRKKVRQSGSKLITTKCVDTEKGHGGYNFESETVIKLLQSLCPSLEYKYFSTSFRLYLACTSPFSEPSWHSAVPTFVVLFFKMQNTFV